MFLPRYIDGMLPKRLVFCGGGTRCLVFLQTLVELETAGILVNVCEYWGTSAGAFLATLLALHTTVKIVKELMFQTDYAKFRDMDITNLLNFSTTWGLDDGSSLMQELERVFELLRVGSKNVRMCDISGLNIIVSDLNTHQPVIINAITYPQMRVITAIRASMSLPILFRPYINPITHHLWVDGGLHANFPWHLLPDDEARKTALGFTFDKSNVGPPRTVTEYILSMIHIDERKKGQDYAHTWPNNILLYPMPPYPAWFMRLRDDDFRLIERIGSDAAYAWFKLQATIVKTTEIPPVCEPQNTLLPTCPVRHTNELSGIQKPLQSLVSVFPPMPASQHVFRRWSV